MNPPGADNSLKFFLVPFLAQVLAPRDALIVHASGVRIGCSGVILPGPSGAGKSTAARLLGGHILSDDIVVVKNLSSEPLVQSTPLGRFSDGPATCPLHAVLFPHKADRFRLVQVTAQQAILRFLAEHRAYLPPASFLDIQRSAVLNVWTLFSRVPAHEMHFSQSGIDSAHILRALPKGGDASATCLGSPHSGARLG